MITLKKYNGITVLRDDLLTGGTKSRFIESLLDPKYDEYVYASPVYGGFQIALSAVCGKIGKKATIFCAKRKDPHPNSLKCKALGAKVMQVPYGYLSNIQSKARRHCERTGAKYLTFGADYPEANKSIADVMREITKEIGEPDEVWCAVGSGTLLKGIIEGTDSAKIYGVQVGAEYCGRLPGRVKIMKYPKPFEKESKAKSPFPSCKNYDLKAWEYCLKNSNGGKVLFWNVM